MQLRAATSHDHDSLWAILEPVIRAGETYALPRDLDRDGALAFWCAPGTDVVVAELDGDIVGSYFVRANFRGGGAHVANAGYVTRTGHTGRGVARAMCAHSLDHARGRGFRAMQFNCVVSSNVRAVKLWQAMGFAIVGTLPGAFAHPALGYVDVFVMFQTLV